MLKIWFEVLTQDYPWRLTPIILKNLVRGKFFSSRSSSFFGETRNHLWASLEPTGAQAEEYHSEFKSKENHWCSLDWVVYFCTTYTSNVSSEMGGLHRAASKITKLNTIRDDDCNS